MSVATVVTQGYGSFGDVAHVVTLGFDIETVQAITEPGLEFSLPVARMHYKIGDAPMGYQIPISRLHYQIASEP